MANDTQTLEVLKKVLGEGVIAFHVVFAKAIGSVSAGLMLSQGYFWQAKSDFKKLVSIEGELYFTKTVDEWFEATGISEEAQRTARDKMKSCGIWKEVRTGLPAKTYYRIEMDSLVAVIHGYLETGKSVADNNRKQKRELARSGSGKFRRQVAVIHGSNNKEESTIESTIESLESNIPAAKKTAGSPLKNPPWTKIIATLFDQVNEQESSTLKVDHVKFNWGAGAGRQFKALKETRAAMLFDIRAKMQREPTEEDVQSGFDYLFRYGFRYLAGIAESKGGTFQFTPAIILNNYNNILQYAKQNHSPRSKHDRANAKRDEAYEDLFRMGLEMDL